MADDPELLRRLQLLTDVMAHVGRDLSREVAFQRGFLMVGHLFGDEAFVKPHLAKKSVVFPITYLETQADLMARLPTMDWELTKKLFPTVNLTGNRRGYP
eukprot:gene5860-5770_t